jgi:hypothetical protein
LPPIADIHLKSDNFSIAVQDGFFCGVVILAWNYRKILDVTIPPPYIKGIIVSHGSSL